MRRLAALVVLGIASRSLAGDEPPDAAPFRPAAYGVEAAGTAGLSGAWGGRIAGVVARERTRVVGEVESIRARKVHPETSPHDGIGSTAVRIIRSLGGPTRRAELDMGVGLRLLGLSQPRSGRFLIVPEATGQLGLRIVLAGPLHLDALVEAGLPAPLLDARAGVVLRWRALDLAARWREYHRLWWRPFRPEWEARGLEFGVTWTPER